jgi:peptide methionine sulfoxide reductase MsrA
MRNFGERLLCGMQQLVRRLPDVVSTRVGYTRGDVRDATYRNHGTHSEAIEILFDPDTMTFRNLLEFFSQIHDPTTLNRQAPTAALARPAIFWRRVRVLVRDQPDRLRPDKQPFLVRRRRREWRWRKGDPR